MVKRLYESYQQNTEKGELIDVLPMRGKIKGGKENVR